MTGWKEMPLSDVCAIFDGPHATPKKQSQGIIFLGISSLNFGGRIDPAFFEYVSEDDYKKWTKRVTPQRNDIVFSYETKLGTAGIIPDNFKCCLGRRMGLLRHNEKILPRFLLYSYLAPYFQNTITENTNTGSTVDRIALTELPNFKISVPELAEQQAIVKILQSIDDKIDLLHRQNATLESMAEALFRQWFVVEAKEEWETCSLHQLCCSVESGGTPKRNVPSYWNGTIPWLTSSEVRTKIILTTNEYISEQGLENSAAKIWSQGTTVIAMYGATAGEVCYLARSVTANQACCGLIPLAHTRAFIYFYLCRNSLFLAEQASGSAQQNLNKGTIADLSLFRPPKDVLLRFEKLAGTYIDKIVYNQTQIRTLEKLRDTLLPRLMSGEVRVKC